MASTERKEGTTLADRYRLDRLIDAHGETEVWRGWDITRDEAVAIKFLLGSRAHNLRLLSREVDALEAIRHPRVAVLRDHGFANAYPFLVLDYVDGHTLAAILRQRAVVQKQLDDDEMFSIIRGVAETLQGVHAAGVIHRDLKPANVMVRKQGGISHPVLLDFGIARLLDRESHDATTVGRVLGTPLYQPPELSAGQVGIGPAADVFGLGVLLFECATLRHAFAVDREGAPASLARPLDDGPNDILAIKERIGNAKRPQLSRYRNGANEALDRLLEDALASDPALRPRDASVFLQRLNAALPEEPRNDNTLLQSTAILTRLISQPVTTKPWRWVTTLAVVAALLLLGSRLLDHTPTPRSQSVEAPVAPAVEARTLLPPEAPTEQVEPATPATRTAKRVTPLPAETRSVEDSSYSDDRALEVEAVIERLSDLEQQKKMRRRLSLVRLNHDGPGLQRLTRELAEH